MSRKKPMPQPPVTRRKFGLIAGLGFFAIGSGLIGMGAYTQKATQPVPTVEPSADYEGAQKANHPSIARRESYQGNGKNAIICIPISHDNVAARTDTESERILDHAREITNTLYDTFHTRRILIEAFDDNAARIYNRNGRLVNLKPDNYATHLIQRVMNERRWQLLPAWSVDNRGPRIIAVQECAQGLERLMATASKNGWFESPQTLEQHQLELFTQMDTFTLGYDKQMDKIIADDPDGEKEYNYVVVQRDREFLDSVTKEPGVTLMWVGGSHIPDLKRQMQAQGISYTILMPVGLQEPPEDHKAEIRKLLENNCPQLYYDIRFHTGQTGRINFKYRNYKK